MKKPEYILGGSLEFRYIRVIIARGVHPDQLVRVNRGLSWVMGWSQRVQRQAARVDPS